MQCLLHTVNLIQSYLDAKPVFKACAWVRGQEANKSVPAMHSCSWVLVAVFPWLLEALPWCNSLHLAQARRFHPSRTLREAQRVFKPPVVCDGELLPFLAIAFTH